jgi:hypothetical protein
LKVGTNDLPSVVKKKVVAVAASVSSIEAFPTVGLALQLEVPTAGAVSTLARRWGRSAGTLAWRLARGGGGQYPTRGDGGGHVRGCPAAGVLPYDITGVWPI